MPISQYPKFPKGSWVRVMHPDHAFYDRVGKVAISGKQASEVDFNEDGRTIRKPFMNTSLQAEATPRKLEPGQAVVVIVESSPHYQRRGVIQHLIAGNEIALIDLGERFRDEVGNSHQKLVEIRTADLQLIDGASSGNDKGDRKLRSAQG